MLIPVFYQEMKREMEPKRYGGTKVLPQLPALNGYTHATSQASEAESSSVPVETLCNMYDGTERTCYSDDRNLVLPLPSLCVDSHQVCESSQVNYQDDGTDVQVGKKKPLPLLPTLKSERDRILPLPSACSGDQQREVTETSSQNDVIVHGGKTKSLLPNVKTETRNMTSPRLGGSHICDAKCSDGNHGHSNTVQVGKTKPLPPLPTCVVSGCQTAQTGNHTAKTKVLPPIPSMSGNKHTSGSKTLPPPVSSKPCMETSTSGSKTLPPMPLIYGSHDTQTTCQNGSIKVILPLHPNSRSEGQITSSSQVGKSNLLPPLLPSHVKHLEYQNSVTDHQTLGLKVLPAIPSLAKHKECNTEITKPEKDGLNIPPPQVSSPPPAWGCSNSTLCNKLGGIQVLPVPVQSASLAGCQGCCSAQTAGQTLKQRVRARGYCCSNVQSYK